MHHLNALIFQYGLLLQFYMRQMLQISKTFIEIYSWSILEVNIIIRNKYSTTAIRKTSPTHLQE